MIWHLFGPNTMKHDGSHNVLTLKRDDHSMLILWNMVAMVKPWHDHDYEITMITV